MEMTDFVLGDIKEVMKEVMTFRPNLTQEEKKELINIRRRWHNKIFAMSSKRKENASLEKSKASAEQLENDNDGNLLSIILSTSSSQSEIKFTKEFLHR